MKIFAPLLSLFFPSECPGCAEFLVGNETAVCLSCLADLRPTGLDMKDKMNELCLRVGGKVPLAGGFALYYFEKKGKMKKMIQALKYRKMPEIGILFGKIMGTTLKKQGFEAAFDLIVPVPVHSSKLAERGYNQAEVIANGISAITGIPVDTGVLAKRSGTVSQTRKGKNERWKNVSEVFEKVGPVSGRVLIVDDVVTTGSTLVACIRELVKDQESDIEIFVAAVAMASHD